MKKICGVLIALFLLFIPVTNKDIVYASDTGISKFYMDATILENGDIRVKELFSLNGEYNGFDRIINYKNSDASEFNSNSDSFGGSSIHNGSGILLRKIGAVEDGSFSTLGNTDGIDAFKLGTGTYGYYEVTRTNNGENYRIYNPSSRGKAFYVEYDLQNMGIRHNDIAELGWNIFSESLTEDIEEFELLIHLPNNQNELRAWAHGPLNGNVEIIDKQTVKVTIKNLSRNRAMDVRLAFDKEVIGTSTKLTDTTALDKILVYEQEKANEANMERTVARFQYYGTYILAGLWIVGLGFIIYRTYHKYDKEYKSDFQIKYHREFPSEYSPEIVGYLMNKEVGTDELSASILNLVYKKVFSVEKVVDGKKDDYEFTYHPDSVAGASITINDTKIIKWLFSDIESGKNTFRLSAFKKEAKSGYTEFLDSYHGWTQSVTADAEKLNFYENNSKGRTSSLLYTIIGIIILFLMGSAADAMIPPFVCLVIGVFAIMYFVSYTKRTKTGNEEYTKWNAFKNFLTDFGNFGEKELPEIALWEKYLVYAVVLDCATELSKTMEIKAAEYYPNMDSASAYHPGYHFYYMTSLNRAINTGVSSAVSSAISTKAAAESSNSSGSGSGGGFSSGGGSFGGGGGGGRF